MEVYQGTITRRLANALDSLEKEYASLITKEDLLRCLKAYRDAYGRSDRGSKLQKLYKMLDLCGIDFEKGQDFACYEALIDRASLPSFTELEVRMLHSLYLLYLDYPAPSDYMKSTVDKLCHPEDGWENDTLRVRILKQFIKYGNWLADARVNGRPAICRYVKNKMKLRKTPTPEQVLDDLDDEVFAVLPTASPDQRRLDGTYGLLKVADDLAQGKFRVEGATRRYLYWFAIVYNMTYYSGSTGSAEILDPQRDIELKLFRDYYTNNLIRFVTKAYLDNPTGSELDPSGQGINYKNFAEMIYLYWICKDLEPVDKIRGAEAMILEVLDRKAKTGPVDTVAAGGTAYFRQLVRGTPDELFSEDILHLPEEAFKDLLCQHFDCDAYRTSYVKEGNVILQMVSPLMLQTEQRSAYREYTRLLRQLADEGITPDRCSLGLWFTDVAASQKERIDDICARWPDTDREALTSFMDLLRAASRFLDLSIAVVPDGEPDAPSQVKPNALYVPSAKYITRTSLVVAYYYLFISENEQPGAAETANALDRIYKSLHDRDDEIRYDNGPEELGRFRWGSFAEVFNAFKAGIDPLLQKAYYQPLSSKNLFDVLLTFSAYAYLNV